MLNYLRLDTVLSPWYKTPVAWYQGAWGLPRYTRAGGSWSDTLRQAALPFTVACDLVYSDDYDRFMVPLGAEAWITPYLAARMGLNINHPADKVHFGAGVRWSNIAFDFDYGLTQPVSSAELESKWLFGLTYSLKSTMLKKEISVAQPPPSKKVLSAPETKTFAPPKTILLKPKQPDSLKTPFMVKDTVSKPAIDSVKTVVSPDTSVSGDIRSPAEKKEAVPEKTPGPATEKPAIPASLDTVVTPDFITK